MDGCSFEVLQFIQKFIIEHLDDIKSLEIMKIQVKENTSLFPSECIAICDFIDNSIDIIKQETPKTIEMMKILKGEKEYIEDDSMSHTFFMLYLAKF